MLWMYVAIVAVMGFVLIKVRRKRKKRQSGGTRYDVTRHAA